MKTLIDWVTPARPITYGILKRGPDQPAGGPYVRVVDMKHGPDASSWFTNANASGATTGRCQTLWPIASQAAVMAGGAGWWL